MRRDPPSPEPPWFGRALVQVCGLDDRRHEVESDLRDLYAARLADQGLRIATWRYFTDVLSLFRYRYTFRLPTPQAVLKGTRAMKHDLVFAIRLFVRQPGLFGATVLGLALAIGISTAVFSIVQAVVFADYGIAAPESVARIALRSGPFTRVSGNSPYRGNWAATDYRRLEEAAKSINVVAALSDQVDFRADASQGSRLSVNVMAVSGSYFPVLGLHTSLGRPLTPSDDEPGKPLVVVSHGFWKNRLGGDPSVLGRSVWLGDRAYTIIGVADRAHSAPLTGVTPPAFWMTLGSNADSWASRLNASAADMRATLDAMRVEHRDDVAYRERMKALEEDIATPLQKWNPAVDVLGRVKADVSRAQAEAEVRAVGAAIASDQGAGSRGAPDVALESLAASSRNAVAVTSFLTVTIGIVVFLACANVTNLLLASAAARRREIGIRLAIGASRGRVVRQLLTESVLLGLAGGLLGLLVAWAFIPSFGALVRLPPAVDASIDRTVLAFVGLLTVIVGFIAGLAPARYGRRGDLASALTSDQPAAPRPLPRSRLRSLLIGAQAASSIMLLVMAALLTRALVENVRLDLGYDANRLVSMTAGSAPAGRAWSPARAEAYWQTALERVRQLPGVAGAALSSIPPFADVTAPQTVSGRRINRNETSPEYFETMGARILRGRIYTADEVRVQAPVAVISARLARDFWGVENPLGSTLERVWGPDGPRQTTRGLQRAPAGTRVIGVVEDLVTDLRSQGAPTLYLPIASATAARMVIRTETDAHSLTRPLQDALQSLDPTLRPSLAFAIDGVQRDLLAPRTMALLATIVGATALGLALIGLFGVTAFVVEQRRHEVSVRKALGASNGQVMSMLFRESLTPVALGLVFGLFFALLGGRVIQGVLYGVSSRDPIAILAAVVVLISAASVAILIPARRAAHISPAQLLKQG